MICSTVYTDRMLWIEVAKHPKHSLSVAGEYLSFILINSVKYKHMVSEHAFGISRFILYRFCIDMDTEYVIAVWNMNWL